MKLRYLPSSVLAGPNGDGIHMTVIVDQIVDSIEVSTPPRNSRPVGSFSLQQAWSVVQGPCPKSRGDWSLLVRLEAVDFYEHSREKSQFFVTISPLFDELVTGSKGSEYFHTARVIQL